MRIVVGLLVTLLVGPACTSDGPDRLQAASGTILVDSGLSDALLALWTGEDVAVRAVGSGEAFELARRGEVDLLFVHEPSGVDALMADGVAVSRRVFARTRYVLVGPPDDPAGVSGSGSYADALRRIGGTEAPFVSRGDDSGTHHAELAYWGAEPDGDWYTRTGQGQAETLRIAGELDGYVLTDMATWLLSGASSGLELLADNDPDRWTDYEVVVVDGPRREAAERFAAFLVAPDAQNIVNTFSLGWSLPEEDGP